MPNNDSANNITLFCKTLTLKKLSAIHDPDEYISEIRKYIEESELTLQRDNQFNFMEPGGGWDSESLRQKASSESYNTPSRNKKEHGNAKMHKKIFSGGEELEG